LALKGLSNHNHANCKFKKKESSIFYFLFKKSGGSQWQNGRKAVCRSVFL